MLASSATNTRPSVPSGKCNLVVRYRAPRLTVASSSYYAQLGAQPLAAYLLVKLPVRPFLTGILFCWGVSLCGMAASNSFSSLAATRFLLGLFEAACLPMFSMITVAWYRRAEQVSPSTHSDRSETSALTFYHTFYSLFVSPLGTDRTVWQACWDLPSVTALDTSSPTSFTRTRSSSFSSD